MESKNEIANEIRFYSDSTQKVEKIYKIEHEITVKRSNSIKDKRIKNNLSHTSIDIKNSTESKNLMESSALLLR
jgi:hypothetical protein